MCTTIHMPYITSYQQLLPMFQFQFHIYVSCQMGKQILWNLFHTRSRRILYWITLSVVPWDFWHDFFYWPTPAQLLMILITNNRSYFWGLRTHLCTLLHSVYFEVLQLLLKAACYILNCFYWFMMECSCFLLAFPCWLQFCIAWYWPEQHPEN